MCINTVLWAFKQENLTGAERYVLIALANHANKARTCWPSLDTIGRFTGLSRRTIQRCLRRLESLGYIKTSTRHEKNQQRSSLYTLVGASVVLGGGVSEAPLGASVWRTEPVTEPVIEPEVPAQGANEPRFKSRGGLELFDLSQRQKRQQKRQQSGEIDSVLNLYSSRPAEETMNGKISDLHEGRYPDTPVDEPPKARLFREGKTILVALGLSEGRSGSVIGRWLKTNPDAVGVLAALEYAYKNNVIEPVAYVTKLLNTGGKTNGNRQEGFDDMVRRLADEARELERKAGIGRAADSFRSH